MATQSTSRWRRFRRNPRALASVIALAALYLCSLFSELICNAKPLLLHANGRLFFPVVQHVSEDDLFGNGVHTRPDYASLATNPAVRAVFAPIRFGPRTIATAASVEPYRRARVSIRPAVRSGRLDVRSDLTVSRSDGLDLFLGRAPAANEKLPDLLALPDDLAAALQTRFANEAAPAETFTLATPGAEETEVTLAAYEPRPKAPRTIRLRLRDARAAKATPASLLFARHDGEPVPVRSSRKTFERLDPETQSAVLAAVHSCLPASQKSKDSKLSTLNSQLSTSPSPRPNNVSVSATLEDVTWPFRPVPGHPMGIDNAGRDVFARVLYGTRTALTFGLLLVAWSLLIGIIAGAAQGYFGGWVDLAGQRFIEIWSALPFLYVMILVGSVFGRSFGLLLFCYGLFNWIGVSYYVRAEFLRLRKRPFVEAAKCQGLGAWRIIRRHILPNALTPVITLLPFNLVGAIASISALDFLGFGLPPLTPSWGELLQQAQQNTSSWWLILYPSLLLFSTMLLTVFVGEGLRDAFDPKPNSRYR